MSEADLNRLAGILALHILGELVAQLLGNRLRDDLEPGPRGAEKDTFVVKADKPSSNAFDSWRWHATRPAVWEVER